MKTITESVFVQALKDLAATLRQREDEGFNRVVEPDAPTVFREVAEQLTNENLEEMFLKCLPFLENLGSIQVGQTVDDPESLQAIAYHLRTMHQNPLQSEGDTYARLSQVLAQKADLFDQKAEALARYLGMSR